jgi:hypothetical protein
MREMLIDLFFPNSQCLRELSGGHLPLAQEIDHLLANRLPLIPMFSFHHSTERFPSRLLFFFCRYTTDFLAFQQRSVASG